jgi:hypothetical protein
LNLQTRHQQQPERIVIDIDAIVRQAMFFLAGRKLPVNVKFKKSTRYKY